MIQPITGQYINISLSSYKKIKKKECDLQIWQYNVRHTNIIIVKNKIIFENVKEKNKLLVNIADIIVLAKQLQTFSPIDFTKKPLQLISNADIDVMKKLKLAGIKNTKDILVK